jgi:hypothetical protein
MVLNGRARTSVGTGPEPQGDGLIRRRYGRRRDREKRDGGKTGAKLWDHGKSSK